jgi:hypothetical protein
MMMCFKQEKEVEGSVAECSHWVGSYSTYRGISSISSISSIINNIRECIDGATMYLDWVILTHF